MFGRLQRFNEKDYITPEAFSVLPALLGTPLAHPSKRLLAWLLDALIVAIIGQLSNALLALALALLFDRILRQTEMPFAQRWRDHLRILVVALFVLWAATEAWSEWHQHFAQKSNATADHWLPDEAKLPKPATDNGQSTGEGDKESDAERVEELSKQIKELKKPQSFSLIDSIKNVLGDVGFDFGWAAVYWTLLTGWWNGQTIGKRLFGLRVIQLNGKPFTMWDSFNRCGGYAAGVATGLLGFAQAWWDSNRQAIHDKVSFTVVVDERRKRISWPPMEPSA